MTIKRGDTRDITVTVTNADGSAYDLSNHTIWFGAKEQHYKADNVAEIFKISTTGGHMTISSNKATAHITPGDTSGMPSRDVRLYYEWQIKRTSDGKVYTVDSGILTVKPDVVRAI